MAHVEALLVQSDSDCPSAEAVQAEVRELTTPEQRRGVPAGAKAVVTDRGESIAIAVTRDGKTTVRVYRDAARDCARRGHFVSVLVVVSLMPPDLGSDPEQPEAPSPEPVAPPPSPVPSPAPAPVSTAPAPLAPSPRHVHLELGLRGEASTPLADSARIAAWGGALGVALGSGDLRFTLGGGYTPRTKLRYTGNFAGSARLEQLDVALGLRLALGHAPVDTSFDAGLLLSRAAVTGLDSHRPAQDTAFSVGARAGFHVGWSEARRFSPFLGAYAAVFPFAPALSELPQGTVGHLPYVWVGLNAGLALAL
ncbi:MAG TPA: hypothetical protein VEQ59_03380 [Polyangiaceae bacterium]|nr:hypothetical protein [Polyangiaceae bacterium]